MKDQFWVEDYSGQPPVCKKRKRRVGKRKIEFVGWGSRPLIEFLEAIGQDTREKHSRHEVAAFITKYVNDNGLASAEKKKKVCCDARLHALFGKKSVLRIKVYDLLEEHFAENHVDDDSDDEDSSEDDDYGERISLGSKKNPTVQTKKVPRTPKSCFAAVIPENIKLIYLKKSVIQELLKFPESSEFKIVGSFVRMKSDPNDIYQKNRFQLQQVTGVENVSGAGTGIRLRVSNFFKDVPIGMLSDDNFSEEEVEDVRDRIKAGLLNRLIVKELQLKAQVLHVDITKHWIAKEISLLQRLIEHANEKGWQRQFTKFEYLERRKMLQTPSEQEKLLLKTPEVIAEELEPEVMVADASGEAEVNACSPKSILRGSSVSIDASGSGVIANPPQVIFSNPHALEVKNGGIDGIIPNNNPKGSGEIIAPSQVIFGESHTLKVQDGSIDGTIPVKDPKGSGDIIAPSRVIFSESYALKVQDGSVDGIIPVKHPKGDRVADIVNKGTLVFNLVGDGSSREMQAGEKGTQAQEKAEKPLVVIDLCDDDSEDEKTEAGIISESPNDRIWFYLDPYGKTQGPFPLLMLKQWNDANYFPSGFTVWKVGQTLHDRVLLVDVLRRNFLN